VTVDGVKHTFDLHYQVKQRPWLMFGGSLLVGYTLGRRGGVQTGAMGWVLLWALGIPIPILLILFVVRGCT
jgi:hypothetical protein